jgi:hypothetical protein
MSFCTWGEIFCRLRLRVSRKRQNEVSSHEHAFCNAGFGIGGLALTYLLNQEGLLAASQDLKPRRGHFPARARAVVHFMQNGGPSQMDLFDPKPELQPLRTNHPQTSRSTRGELRQISPAVSVRPRQVRHGTSDAMPHLATVADDITLVRSMF